MNVLYHCPELPIPCHWLRGNTEIKEYVNTVFELGSHIIHEEKNKPQVLNRVWNIVPGSRHLSCYIFRHFSNCRALFENVLVQLRCFMAKVLQGQTTASSYYLIIRGKKKSLLNLIDLLCFSKNVLLMSGAFYIAGTSLLLFPKKPVPSCVS